MDTPEEFIEKIHKFQNRLQAELPKFVNKQAMNATGLIINRIQERGLNADETQLGIYTSTPYKNKRKKAGRQTDYVDETFTRGGAGMLGSTGIVQESYSEGVAMVKVAGRDEFTQNKLDWNGERYGDILNVTKAEDQLMLDNFEEFINDLIIEAGI